MTIGLADDFKLALSFLRRQFGHNFHGAGADLAGGGIDDPMQAHAVVRVVDHLQISAHIPDLHGVQKGSAPHHGKGDPRADKAGLQEIGQGVVAVKNSKGFQRLAPAVLPVNGLRDIAGLFLLIFGLIEKDLFPRLVFGPKGLPFSTTVTSDHMVGRRKNVAGRAVILLQTDGLRVGILMLKLQNILDGGATELINALVVVSHHTEVAPAPRKQRAEHILGVVGVLIFVYQHIAEPPLIFLPHIIAGLEKLNRFADDVVEIQRRGSPAALVVFRVNPGDGLFVIIFAGVHSIVFRRHQILFCPGDLPHHAFGIEAPLVKAKVLENGGNHPLFIIFVVDGEGALIPQTADMPAQNAGACRVEGMSPDIPSFFAAGHLQAGAQFSRRLIGKGDGDDLPRAGRIHSAQPRNLGGGKGFGISHQPCQKFQFVVPRPIRCKLAFIAAAEAQ